MLNVLLLTGEADHSKLVSAVQEGRRWMEGQAGRPCVPFRFEYLAPMALTGAPDTWFGQVWAYVSQHYPEGRYLCFVQGAGGVAGGNFGDGYGVAAVGDWCIRSIVDGKTPEHINGETLPLWLINAGRNGQMGTWIHEAQHTVGGLHEDGGVMAEHWAWPDAGLPARLHTTPLFVAPKAVPKHPSALALLLRWAAGWLRRTR